MPRPFFPLPPSSSSLIIYPSKNNFLSNLSLGKDFVMISRRDKPIANPLVVLREEFDDWAVLFNPDTARALGINPVGVAVWKGMDGKSSLEEIVSEIKDCFEGVPENAFQEVTSFVNTLTEEGFVGFELESDSR
jgi:SynChlorMet cassette protein ScmD